MTGRPASRPDRAGTARDLFFAGVGVATIFVELPIIKMILDDPQVLALTSWTFMTSLLFCVITFVLLPIVCGAVCAMSFRLHARLGLAVLTGLMAYLVTMSVNFHYLLRDYPAAAWREAAIAGIFIGVVLLTWWMRRSAIEILKICSGFGAVIAIVFVYHAVPVGGTGALGTVQAQHTTTAAPPVFFLTFEKLAAPFVLNEEEEVFAEELPNLAQFVSSADLYPNAYANSSSTVYALKTLYSGRLATFDTRWKRRANLRDLLGANRHVVMLMDTVGLDYCRPKQDTCIQGFGGDPTGGVDAIAGVYRAFAYTILPGRVQVELAKRVGWRFDPRSQLWAREQATLKPGETIEGKVGRRQFNELLNAVRQTQGTPALYLMHNFISDAPGGTSSVLAGRTKAERLRDLERARTGLSKLDRALGRFLDQIKQLGLYDDALIVITSDTGYDAGLSHASGDPTLPASDEILRVFLAIKRPNQQDGRVIRATARQIDVLPTVMHNLGMDPETYAFEGEPVTDPDDTSRLADRPVEFLLSASLSGVSHYELRDPEGPLRRLKKRGLPW